ncbi:MAG TPA: peptidoglycan recognition family protein [Pyrinomonadaceae bacterium]|nr:peptidoglycan recognition family protein [Pyrinomonadaceae bacterium]
MIATKPQTPSVSQLTTAEATLFYSKTVERYAHFFDRPEQRLRFLNNTLAHQIACKEKLDRVFETNSLIKRLGLYDRVKRAGFYDRLLDLWLHRHICRELQGLLPSASNERRSLLQRSKASFTTRLLFRCYEMRRLLYGAAGTACVVALLGFAYTAVWTARRMNSYLASRSQTERRFAKPPADSRNAAVAAPGVKHLPDYHPEKVWLVEQQANYERYSNGARILTDYETTNHTRGYVVLPRAQGTLVKTSAAEQNVKRDPVGIVYHTSESDMLPFTSDNNASIEVRTRGLLEYVRRNKSYNYLIDRFGQIYRVVRDSDAAHHAGNSVWSDDAGVYVGLNESFLGVCFETNSKSDSLDEQLTEAQLVAGRLLTQVLRSRYNISDAGCVTHGLVSVNPSNMLICYHHDWARNFPFEAFGLSDKYKVAPASVSEFGFTYDEEIMEKLGGDVWAGVKIAEEEFRRRAEESNVTPEEMRRRMRERYQEEMNLTLRLRTSHPAEAETGRQTNDPTHTPASRPNARQT